jgi:hypothetical protein
MSFDFPAQPQRQVRPRGGGCGRLVFMMIIMFAVYYMFSAGRPRQQNPQRGIGGPGDILAPDPTENDRDRIKRDIFGDGTVPSAENQQGTNRKMPSTGRSGSNRGWEMEDVPSGKTSEKDFRNDSRLPSPSDSNSRSKNDWSIDDVDGTTAEAVPATQKQVPPKKAKSDWTLEEVD